MSTNSVRVIVCGSLIAATLMSQNTYACGFGVGEALGGDRILAISVVGDNQKQVIVDDDGYVVLSLMAVECQKTMSRPHLTLTPEQDSCVYSAQESIDSKIFTNRVPANYRQNKRAGQAIKDACGFDIIQKWDEVLETSDRNPLQCVDRVRSIVSRAVARASEFTKEKMTPEFLKAQGIPDAVASQFLDSNKRSFEQAKKFEQMLANPSVTEKDFRTWLPGLKETVESRTYQMKPNASDPWSADAEKSIQAILKKLEVDLPPYSARMSRCFSLDHDFAEKLKNATWVPRTGSPASGASGVAR